MNGVNFNGMLRKILYIKISNSRASYVGRSIIFRKPGTRIIYLYCSQYNYN